MAAEMALAMVNLEVGLDYWLPGDAHQELQRVRHEVAERHGADCTALPQTKPAPACLSSRVSRPVDFGPAL